ncbi:MAG TPA: two-component regulator propeller domain-containing protein [Bacteroidia bacterium]|nr:two-component regulator propeller domain-containing protein [Bacteroidia bacterium]
MLLILKFLNKNLHFKIIFLLVFFSAHLSAQQLILKNYKVKDGLPSSEVYCAFQDSKGFMWFGSDCMSSK